MPERASAICRELGCNELTTDKSRRCPAHKDKGWRRYTPTPQRTSGRTLQQQRRKLFKRNPLCVACEAKGLVVLAVVRDHIIPLAEGGSDDDSNTQGLCKACHDVKSQEEAKRGRARQHTHAQPDTDKREPPRTICLA